VPTPSELSFLGIGKEVTPGTAVVSTAYLGCSKIKQLQPIDYMLVPGFRASMVEDYGAVQGFKWGGVECAGPVYADTIGWPLMGILGDITTTGAGAPFTHAGSLKNSGLGQPTTQTVNNNAVAANRALAGLNWVELDIKWTAAGLIEFSAKGFSLTTAVVAKPTFSMTAILPTPTYIGLVTIAGGAIAKTVSGHMKFTRKHEIVKAINNTQAPLQVFLSSLRVEFEYEALMDDETELTRYLTNTQPSLDFNFSQGAGAAATQLLLHCSSTVLDGEPDVKQELGKPVYIAMKGKGLGSSTDAGASGGVSPVKATLQNALPAATYI
jgi:hypothetical protein